MKRYTREVTLKLVRSGRGCTVGREGVVWDWKVSKSFRFTNRNMDGVSVIGGK